MEKPGPLASQEEYEQWHNTHCDGCGREQEESRKGHMYCADCERKEAEGQHQQLVLELLETIPGWKLTAIAKLIEDEPMENEGATLKILEDNGSRFYLSSNWYGSARYHVVTTGDGATILEQCDHNERYQQRITLEPQEVPLLVSQLLKAWLATQEPRPANGGSFDDDLGDLDSAIF